MKKCLKCGSAADDADNYCSVCGSKLEAAKAPHLPEEISDEEQQPVVQSLFLKYSDFIDDKALFRAAVCKADGIGVKKDEAEAFEIFRLLAFRGNYDAMYRLAEIYLNQDPPDAQTALNWLKIAADGGHGQSRIRLKVLGLDVPAKCALEIPEYASELEALVRQALPSIVMIRSCQMKKKNNLVSTGSGFIVAGGHVITNAHVVGKNPVYITAGFEQSVDDKTYNLLPVCIRPDLDIAVLKFTGLAGKKFAERDNLSFRLENIVFGEDVYTVGNPLGIGLSVSKGVVSCPNRESDYPSGVKEVIQTDITANHGNSGGALLDSNNNVLGMITFVPGSSEGGIAMCVPAKHIVQVLNNL